MTENQPRLKDYFKDLIYILIQIVCFLIRLCIFTFTVISVDALLNDIPFKSKIFEWMMITVVLGEIIFFQKLYVKDNRRLFGLGLIGVGIFNYAIVFIYRLVIL